MPRGGVVGVVLVVAVSLLLLLPAAALGGAPPPPAQRSAFAAAGQIDADTVQLDVTLQPDGDAYWEIRYRVLLDDDNATAAFESLARDVEANRSTFATRFAGRIDRTVSTAENATGREMSARNVSVRTTRQEIPQRYGVLIYSFEWTGFATTDGTQIRAGDAIGGLFLDESTSLSIRWPAGYGPVSTDPSPDSSGDRSATWRGPLEFTTEQPRIVVSSAAETEGPGTTTVPVDESGGIGVGTGAAIAVLGLFVLVGAAWLWRRREPAGPGSGPDSTDEAPPEELLSNEERVVRLLREHGGRMKQQQVVEALGWTDAKTSQVVGSLRESGVVEGFRLGRENVLRLPEAEEEGDD